MAAIVKLYEGHDSRNIGKYEVLLNNLFSDVFQYFRLFSNNKETVHLQFDDDNYILNMEIIENNTIRSKLPSGKVLNATIIQLNEEILRVVIEEEVHLIRYFLSENKISIWSKHLGKFVFKVESQDQRNVSSDQEAKDFDGRIISSMPCKLNQIMVLPGDKVHINSPLCVTESMKMEVLFNILIIKSSIFS